MKTVLSNVVIAVVICVTPGLQSHGYAQTLCGDVDGNGLTYTVGDMVYLARYIFGNAPAIAPLENSDVDLCGTVNISDLALYIDFFAIGLPSGICEPQEDCFPETGTNEIALGCPLNIPTGDWDSVPLPVYISNDVELAAISIGIHYDFSGISISSVDISPSILPSSWEVRLVTPEDTAYVWPVEDSNFVFLTFYWGGQGPGVYLEPQQDGLLVNLWLHTPSDVVNQPVNLDSMFVEPAGEFMFSPTSHGTLYPAFVDCGSIDIVIGAYTCGDADQSGTVDIDDVLYMLQCIFVDCLGTPLEQLDINCSGVFDIDDIVYLISYIFNGGPAPCDPDGNGLPCA